MCITEYNEQETMYAIREEAREEGREEGIEKGREEGIEKGLKALVNTLKKYTSNIETLYEAVLENEEYANVTLEQVKKYY